MSDAATDADTPADPAAALVAAARGAEALAGERLAAAGVELSRPPGFGIDDGARARSAAIVAQLVSAAETALRTAEPAFAALPEGAAARRFASAGLLARSGLGAAVLRRAEEHRLAAALAMGAGEEEGPGARRLDPIGGSFVAESFAVRAAEAARIDRTGEPLLPLADCDAEDRHALFWQVAACLSFALLDAEDRPVDAVHRLASAGVGRALAAIDESDGIAAAAMALAHALAGAGQIDDELLAGTLAGGRVASLAAMLAVRAGIGFDEANGMLTDPARATLLLRACGVERNMAAAMILALCYALDRGFPPVPAEKAAALVGGYEALAVEDARAEVRRARLEPFYRDAFAALTETRC